MAGYKHCLFLLLNFKILLQFLRLSVVIFQNLFWYSDIHVSTIAVNWTSSSSLRYGPITRLPEFYLNEQHCLLFFKWWALFYSEYHCYSRASWRSVRISCVCVAASLTTAEDGTGQETTAYPRALDFCLSCNIFQLNFIEKKLPNPFSFHVCEVKKIILNPWINRKLDWKINALDYYIVCELRLLIRTSFLSFPLYF